MVQIKDLMVQIKDSMVQIKQMSVYGVETPLPRSFLSGYQGPLAKKRCFVWALLQMSPDDIGLFLKRDLAIQIDYESLSYWEKI